MYSLVETELTTPWNDLLDHGAQTTSTHGFGDLFQRSGSIIKCAKWYLMGDQRPSRAPSSSLVAARRNPAAKRSRCTR